ncbi:MAG: hypothetical protein IKY23_01615 [Lachnospiraceae bacterium]|nr:hypothetical protein [Lachnospiraceae bacterium]
MEYNEEKQSDMELHPELARQRQNTHSSLTDLSGIAVFSDEFERTIHQVKQKNEASEKEIKDKLFFGEMMEMSGRDDLLRSRVFAEKKEQSFMQDYQVAENKFSFLEAGLVLGAILGMSAIYLFLFREKTLKNNGEGRKK